MDTLLKPLDGQQHIHVLVIEPDAALGNLVRLVLESDSCRVTVATTAHAALAAASADAPHLVILDGDAPGVSRETAVTALRMLAGARLPVLQLTTQPANLSNDDGLFYDTLRMPFELTDLITSIEPGIAQAQLLDKGGPRPLRSDTAARRDQGRRPGTTSQSSKPAAHEDPAVKDSQVQMGVAATAPERVQRRDGHASATPSNSDGSPGP